MIHWDEGTFSILFSALSFHCTFWLGGEDHKLHLMRCLRHHHRLSFLPRCENLSSACIFSIHMYFAYSSARISAGFPYTKLMPTLLSSLAYTLTTFTSSLSILCCSAAALLFRFAFLFFFFLHIHSCCIGTQLDFFSSGRPVELF